MPNMWIPSGFNPEGVFNPTWGFKGRGIEEFEIVVYNRWGELVWQSDDLNKQWDGTFNGHPVQQDVYVYKLTYSFYDVQNVLKKRDAVGTVTIIR